MPASRTPDFELYVLVFLFFSFFCFHGFLGRAESLRVLHSVFKNLGSGSINYSFDIPRQVYIATKDKLSELMLVERNGNVTFQNHPIISCR